MRIPVGCLVHEEELGGWVKFDPNNIAGDDRGIGKLDRRLVRFDYEDDCDRESFLLDMLLLIWCQWNRTWSDPQEIHKICAIKKFKLRK
jgi:hypothetical protein